jgi:hypothetical protein
MKMFIRHSLLVLTAIISTSCTQRLVDFTIISTKNVDLSRASSFVRSGSRATGEDAKLIIIVFPTGVPSAKEAVDRAIESVPGGVALVDGVLTSSFFYIPYVVGENKFVVEGTVLVDPTLSKVAMGPAQGALNRHHIVICNKSGEVVEKRAVSKEDYSKFKRKYGLVASR